MTSATFVRYQSKPAYVRSDEVKIDVVGPYGAEAIIRYTVNVYPAT